MKFASRELGHDAPTPCFYPEGNHRLLRLLFPEWQGYGETNTVRTGALQLAALVPEPSWMTIEVPEDEPLVVEDHILGLRANVRLLEQVAALLRQQAPERIFLLGGTCAAELGPVSYLNQRYAGNLTVLWFDAHGDLNTPNSSPSGHLHGMPLRILLGEGHPDLLRHTFGTLRPEQVILVGTRDLDPAEQELIDNTGIAVLQPEVLHDPDNLSNALTDRGVTNLYLHLDLDILDPHAFPHLLMPTPGGISTDQLRDLLQAVCTRFPIVGASLVEYVPHGTAGDAFVRELMTILGGS